MKIITVFTPTFNRAHTLPRVYESLVNQTNKNFDWLIIDDGSKDETSQLVSKWIDDKLLNITYIYQENIGMHGAHNTAFYNINTALSVCCDSDDFLHSEAISNIMDEWDNIKDDEKFSGIVALDSYLNGEIVAVIPKELKETTLFDLRYKYKIGGDVKLVYKTELMKMSPYPIIPGEKYLAVGYKYFNLDNKYKLKVLNKVLCYVDYQLDGGTKNKLKLYRSNPKGFIVYRMEMIKNSPMTSVKFRHCIHLVSSCIFAKNLKYITKKGNVFLKLIAIPFGIILSLYIVMKTKSNNF